MKYPNYASNEWLKPAKKAFRFMCCDCSLVHEIDFRIVDSKNKKLRQVQIRVRRNDRATAAARRHKAK
jgi:hypothetical protein